MGNHCWLKESVILDGRTNRDTGIRIGDDVIIRAGSYIDAYGDCGYVHIGDRVGVGQYVYIGGNGGVTLEDDVMISGHSYLVSATRYTDPNNAYPYSKQGEARLGIVVRRNAWIAANCTILDGVEIGEGAVVGAGSVVTRDVPPAVVVAGNPARKIRLVKDERTRLGYKLNELKENPGNEG
ncbi:acyltransferase [Micromonospora sp. NPDC048905]|uniref:acyltransferase n=1 Tax=Micromonospora sp. NPDC048905 TaxID=3155494 RepID=UPI0033E36EF1